MIGLKQLFWPQFLYIFDWGCRYVTKDGHDFESIVLSVDRLWFQELCSTFGVIDGLQQLNFLRIEMISQVCSQEMPVRRTRNTNSCSGFKYSLGC